MLVPACVALDDLDQVSALGINQRVSLDPTYYRIFLNPPHESCTLVPRRALIGTRSDMQLGKLHTSMRVEGVPAREVISLGLVR